MLDKREEGLCYRLWYFCVRIQEVKLENYQRLYYGL